MIHDFSKECNTYSADSYKKKDFARTRCPKCFAVGQFNLHGSYYRHIVYLNKLEVMYILIKIKRVRCLSCNTTHAVMPGDLIPYKLLSLLVVLLILNLFYLVKTPVLKIAETNRFSFQFIYSALFAFRKFASTIYLYFKEVSPSAIKPDLDGAGILALIKKPYIEFQYGFMKSQKRPCFMCKFFHKANAPSIGIYAPYAGPKENNISLE